ncbi:class I SAM-dependent methyltransferase [Methylobacterium gossipiicola]|uniref:Methyltransferase domain-containing protein n=1 Tax=Methylobacterium gossipiicola TaxID=582675 RepID=A0A1I2TDI9_9HYPH|nr:class I SAM-dependent methyltransferase [Methylobacterium gossipiicola]SFG63003.1 Methyltransferase domain-containing protein [Methylobacterium gossipiicola]
MTRHIELIERSDPEVFVVESQSTDGDRTSFLDIQNIVRNNFDRYIYLEVGSHLGGTLVPHLLDPRCSSVISVDPRPPSQPDERGLDFDYEGNSTARMVEGLSKIIPRSGMLKLRTFDLDVSDLSPEIVSAKANLALIDGEHTNRACFRDFMAVLGHVTPDCIIAFHDANLIYDALLNVETFLKYERRKFTALYLRHSVFAIGLGSMAIALEALRRDAYDPNEYVTNARNSLQASLASR